jgi:hypothetical protein
MIRTRLEKDIGSKHGIEDIQKDNSWDTFTRQAEGFGALFGAGKLKVAYIDKEGPLDFILLPGTPSHVLSMDPKCPRDRILMTLMAL